MQYRIGVDLGGTGIKVGIIDESKAIVSRAKLPTGAQRHYTAVVADIAQAVEKAMLDLSLSYSDVVCLGVGCPGFVNPKTGLLAHAGNLNWHNVPLKATLEKHTGAPVYVGNDANCAVVGEMVAGAAQGWRNVLLFTLGTGIGCGIILDGALFTGIGGMGAEAGHTVLVYDGEPCTCGIRGCFEAYASVTALIRQTKAIMAVHPESMMHEHFQRNGCVNGRTSFDCAKKDDAAALAVVRQYIRYVAAGIGSQISVFRPEIVLIGGGISAQGDYLINPLNEEVGKYVFAYAQVGAPPIVQAALGNDAGIIGAAYLDTV